jgi:hypothetical protein
MKSQIGIKANRQTDLQESSINGQNHWEVVLLIYDDLFVAI